MQSGPDSPHYSLEMEIFLVGVYLGVAECLLKDLGILLVNSRLSFLNCTLWEGNDEGKSFNK